MKYTDLTGKMSPGMWSYGPPLTDLSVRQVATIEEHGWVAQEITLSGISGTYLETSAHMYAGRETVAEISLDRLIRPALVVHLEQSGPLQEISLDEFVGCIPPYDLHGGALLVSTGWDRNWDDGHAFTSMCPYFRKDVLDWIVDKGIDLLGVDIPSIQDPRGDDGTLVREYFKNHTLLLAPLVNLRAVTEGVHTLICMPLKVDRICSAPCRAVLVESEFPPASKGAI